jgi:hypothetical protein
MLFRTGNSALVRLSDTIKVSLRRCAELRVELLALMRPEYKEAHLQAQAIAKRAENGEIEYQVADYQMRGVLSAIPHEIAVKGVFLQSELHGQALSVILGCCFTLESYINSLAHFLFREDDFLGLVRAGHHVAADLLVEAFDDMSTAQKWETVGRLHWNTGFDHCRAPWQDFKWLFRFRDDHVHSKVRRYSEDYSDERYNGKLPDPVFGLLDLQHALYGADVYWNMVQEVHRLLGLDQARFHRHYNLMPLPDEASRSEWVKLSERQS